MGGGEGQHTWHWRFGGWLGLCWDWVVTCTVWEAFGGMD